MEKVQDMVIVKEEEEKKKLMVDVGELFGIVTGFDIPLLFLRK